jgi:hypothetical protein
MAAYVPTEYAENLASLANGKRKIRAMMALPQVAARDGMLIDSQCHGFLS